MHYYQFNISDYRSATVHLTNEEDLAYRRLLDMYYDSEQKIPLDTQWVARRIRVVPSVVEDVLNDMFVKQDDGWFHARCHEVILQYHSMAEKNRANGKLGGRRKNPVGSHSQPIDKATINQELITNNHKLIEKKTLGKRLANDFNMPDSWGEFCEKERSDLTPIKVFEQFKDYWISQPGQKGVKLDWFATWRNWVRSTNAPKQNPADIVRLTVPSKNEPDPALEKIKADALKAAPMPDHIRQAMQELRKKA
jgi:hypothetical protein